MLLSTFMMLLAVDFCVLIVEVVCKKLQRYLMWLLGFCLDRYGDCYMMVARLIKLVAMFYAVLSL